MKYAILILLFANQCFAQSLSENVLPAGKSIVAQILDSSNNDITSQYTLSYSGSELRITAFAGKSVLIGSKVGTWNITGTKISDSSTISLPVSVTPGLASNLSVLDGSGQSALVNTDLANPLRIKVTDSFGNASPSTPVSFSIQSGSAKINQASSAVITSDSSGIAAVQLTAGSMPATELISASIAVGGSTKTLTTFETTTIPPNQAAKMKVSSLSATINIGQSISLTAQAIDSTGSLSPTYSGMVTVSGFQNSGCSQPSTSQPTGTLSIMAQSGIAQFSNIQPQAAEPLYLKISGVGLAPICSQAISVLPPSTGLSKLKITQLPILLKKNQNFFPALIVKTVDNNNQLISDSQTSIQINEYDDSACTTLSSTQLTNNTANTSSGYAMYSRLQSTQAKTIYLKAVSGSISSDCSGPLVVTVDFGNLGPSTIWSHLSNMSTSAGGKLSTAGFTFSYSWSSSAYSDQASSLIKVSYRFNPQAEYTVGLSTGIYGTDIGSVKYGFFMMSGFARVMEYGNRIIDIAYYNSDDVFSVEANGTTVVYKMNGAVVYTSIMPQNGAVLYPACLISTSGYAETVLQANVVNQ
jgi:hypothetical protein